MSRSRSRRVRAARTAAALGAVVAVLATGLGALAPHEARADERSHSAPLSNARVEPVPHARTAPQRAPEPLTPTTDDRQPTAPESAMVDVPAAPGSDATIVIDTDLYLPSDSGPAPAVLLAHGFGASKEALATEALRLRDDGYVVMAYTARGFGESGGQIALDSLDYEVADARALVDLLATRDDVLEVDGDPVVGVVGASYGGALALMLGATDDRVDTVVAAITWNELADALVPNAAAPDSSVTGGVFKQGWAAQLFGNGASAEIGACGRFTVELCDLYSGLVAGEPLSDADRDLLANSSPSSVLDRMTAPTLLLQGTRDTLFGLDQADANARQIAAAGAPVQVTWFDGGHDSGGASITAGSDTAGSSADTSAGGDTTEEVDAWLAERLPSNGDDDQLPFTFAVPASSRSFDETRTAENYPEREGAGREVALSGPPRAIINPPGALPATTTYLPGVGSLDALTGGLGAAVGGAAAGAAESPAQVASFISEPLDSTTILAGTPTVSLEVASAAASEETATAPDEAVLFAQLRVIPDDSPRAVGGGGVAPVRVSLAPDGSPTTVSLALPTTTWRFEAGDRVELVVRTTDALYLGSPTAASFIVGPAGPILLPTVDAAAPTQSSGSASPGTVIAIAVVLIVAVGLILVTAVLTRRRRAGGDVVADGEHAGGIPSPDDAPPLVIHGLTKDYRSGFRAVDDLSFTVERGQVLGLLGPNGAGKTTALRMVTGLLRPGAGRIEIFGHPLTPGAPVLARVGCFIEGPGFLSHLSGRRNLELYWAASGRPAAEARFDEALAIADLGSAIRRRVGGYSQGMRQRLAIAQAMLGMPELLILDEPTNGLDPPQIHALRGVLRSYAASGRTVIVSSHLLGEVEQTCSHVVVMAQGRLIASGTVAELAGDATELTIEVTDADAAASALALLTGVRSRLVAPGSVRVIPGGHTAEDIVAALVAAGVGVRSVTHGRHLEETFLAMVGDVGAAR